jgi:hypothetical protein
MSGGQVGGYAGLVGASRIPGGVQYLREILASKRPGSPDVGALGLAATGDGVILEELVRRGPVEEDHIETFLRIAGEPGWETLVRLATAPQTTDRVAGTVARLSAAHGRPGAGALIEQLWQAGARPAAIEGCAALRTGKLGADAEARLRDMVFEAIRAGPSAERRSAIYAVEYNKVFQTEDARNLLEGIVAREADPYWVDAARAALRSVEKALRRAEARGN